MNADLKIAADLRKAADYLRTHGWVQFDLGRDGGPRCLLGAFDSICAGREWPAMCALFPLAGGSIVNWNNAPGRTLAEVLDRLESTALGLEIRALSETLEVAVPLAEVAVA